ncbi:alpha-tocopherol transfer protein [Parasteatoda tepidariorum]|uniref:alpha-tocopherol transfer protein n=1 Tax=Parasteatoda tepidariorum TaxID=114398 RepID=UPI00077FB52A|nr:alpha-tocopherol transfer protein [Parasteatoda tepidariorum]
MSSKYDEIMATKAFLPYRMGYLTDWMINKAKEELNETDEIRGPALAEFRRLIAKKTDLDCWTDDAYLLQYLRARKFNVKNAMERLHNLYTVKKNFSDVYPENLDLDTLKKLLDCGGSSCLPYRDDNGSIVIVLKIAKWDPDIFTFRTALTVMTATILCTIEDPATQVCGIQALVDMQGASMKHIRQITPRYIQLLSYALRNALPVRFKGIHIFNESIFFGYIYSILKIFLTEKIKKRFHFHGSDTKHLQKYLPKEILPAEYDGDNIHYNPKDFCQKEMELFYEKYAEMHRIGYR